jgi:DNA-binding transcriptional MerR regulator
VLTIGPFSRIAGVSPKVLRTYDALGLFRPVWLERDSGYRYYSPAQLPEIRRILALRDLGIGLAEIAGLVDGGTDLRQALARRRAELERSAARSTGGWRRSTSGSPRTSPTADRRRRPPADRA